MGRGTSLFETYWRDLGHAEDFVVIIFATKSTSLETGVSCLFFLKTFNAAMSVLQDVPFVKRMEG